MKVQIKAKLYFNEDSLSKELMLRVKFKLENQKFFKTKKVQIVSSWNQSYATFIDACDFFISDNILEANIYKECIKVVKDYIKSKKTVSKEQLLKEKVKNLDEIEFEFNVVKDDWISVEK